MIRLKMQYDIKREASKLLTLSTGKLAKYEHLTDDEILPLLQSRMIKQTKFTYFPSRKAFEKQVKAIED